MNGSVPASGQLLWGQVITADYRPYTDKRTGESKLIGSCKMLAGDGVAKCDAFNVRTGDLPAVGTVAFFMVSRTGDAYNGVPQYQGSWVSAPDLTKLSMFGAVPAGNGSK